MMDKWDLTELTSSPTGIGKCMIKEAGAVLQSTLLFMNRLSILLFDFNTGTFFFRIYSLETFKRNTDM